MSLKKVNLSFIQLISLKKKISGWIFVSLIINRWCIIFYKQNSWGIMPLNPIASNENLTIIKGDVTDPEELAEVYISF